MFFPVPPSPDPAAKTESQSEPNGTSPAPEGGPAPGPIPQANANPQAFRGSIKLFRLLGTDVFIHWSWFVVAFFLIQDRPIPYSSLAWDAGEYVAIFGLVLLHEFGHVLACRSVGGKADRVVLWPLGGLAFVAPPPRAGALFWTIVAGPLVNVVLSVPLIGLAFLTAPTEGEAHSDLGHLFFALAWFNLVMFVFNLLPIFPLDGGRILQAILWRWLGRSAALAVASWIGMLIGAALVFVAVSHGEWWLTAMAVFLVLGALGGISHSQMLSRMEKANRHTFLVCPNCGLSPPAGDFWRCSKCLAWFDLFEPGQNCPKWGVHTADWACPECGQQFPATEWVPQAPAQLADHPPP